MAEHIYGKIIVRLNVFSYTEHLQNFIMCGIFINGIIILKSTQLFILLYRKWFIPSHSLPNLDKKGQEGQIVWNLCQIKYAYQWSGCGKP